MKLPDPLYPGRLIRRYKRFLADVRLASGEEVTAHCANPGSMLGLAEPGFAVWLSKSDDPKRKLSWSWELVEVDDGAGPTLVGIHTGRPNAVAEEAIRAGAIAELTGYGAIRREVRYGRNSRIDLLLEGAGRSDCYVEIKNVHLSRAAGLAEFPDSVTKRGAKHLTELSDMVAAGNRAVMLYLVQRGDGARFALAGDIDPGYAAAFAAARAAGVETIAYVCDVTLEAVFVARPIPVIG